MRLYTHAGVIPSLTTGEPEFVCRASESLVIELPRPMTRWEAARFLQSHEVFLHRKELLPLLAEATVEKTGYVPTGRPRGRPRFLRDVTGKVIEPGREAVQEVAEAAPAKTPKAPKAPKEAAPKAPKATAVERMKAIASKAAEKKVAEAAIATEAPVIEAGTAAIVQPES